jgi:ABC-type nickel/cobalt efflux system permease component RcnA
MEVFTRLITLPDLTPASLLLALGVAFLWGGLHSLTPGHGKTVVAAYLVGSRGTARHAIYLGLVTTLTHTAGVFLLGVVTYFASRTILPERLFPWISLVSGALVVTIGISLFASRLRGVLHLPARAQRHGYTEKHAMTVTAKAAAPPLQGDPVRAVPIAVRKRGFPPVRVPVRGTVHRPIDGDVHSHGADGHWHSHPHESTSTHTHGSEDHDHGHGPAGHTHLPPGGKSGQVTWRSLLALGISGGLLPCPSALVVLLGAIALNRVGFGILLVLVFSLGLASVLSGIGLLLVYSRRFFDRLPVPGRLTRVIPVGSALFITILGLGITLRALGQLGWAGF